MRTSPPPGSAAPNRTAVAPVSSHVIAETTQEAYDRVAPDWWSLLSAQGRTWTSPSVQDRDLEATFPESAKRAYDVHPLIETVVDDAQGTVELHPKWAPSIVTTLGRFGGRTVGCHRQQPAAARRMPRRQLGGEGQPVRADVRRVRGAPDGAGRRAGVPARCRSGVGRRRTPRRQAAARVRRGGSAPGHPRDAQDLRRRVHRDELPLPRCDEGASPGPRPRSP